MSWPNSRAERAVATGLALKMVQHQNRHNGMHPDTTYSATAFGLSAASLVERRLERKNPLSCDSIGADGLVFGRDLLWVARRAKSGRDD